MNTWKHGIIGIIAITVLAVTACDDKPQPKTFTVTFDADNGTAHTTQTVTEGSKVEKPTDPAKDGFNFVYWFNVATDTEWDFNTPITASLTLKAKWNINRYTITFDADNGTAHTTQTVSEGSKVEKPTDPAKDGVNFVYWFNEATDTEWDFDTPITAHITLKAKWMGEIQGMVFVQGGTFTMGSPVEESIQINERPQHQVTLTAFYIGKYEVTQSQYQTVMGSLPSQLDSESNTLGKGNNYPVYFIDWYDAIEFCNTLSVLEGLTPYYTVNKEQIDPNNESDYDTLKWLVTLNTAANGYRLPTEAQWEYAAKGGNKGEKFTYAGSDTADDVAWYNSNGGRTTKEAGTKAPNGLGLYDMSGNVNEWCWDWFGSYENETQTNPTGASSGSRRMLRGGNWGDSADNIRSAGRSSNHPNDRFALAGFRIVLPIN